MRPEAAGENRLRAQFWLLLALVTVDVVSKLMALRLLSSKPGDDSGAAIQWELAVNPVGLGGAGRRLVGDQGANLVLVGAVLCAEIACALVILVRMRRLTAPKVAIATAALAASIPVVTRLAALVDVSPHISIVLLRGAQGVLWLLVWMALKRPLWKVGALLFAAAATGNFLSFLYPPFGIVDFIWSPPLHRAIGLGIFNFADILWHFGIVVFVVATLTSLGSLGLARLRRTARVRGQV
jgi:lipoprotein signal peptidase